METVSSAQSVYDSEIDPQFLLEPIEFLFAEHYRQRLVCNRLDELLGAPPFEQNAVEFGALLRFLKEALPLHIADEEETLFPLLSKRCQDGDNYSEIYVLLQEEHEIDEDLSDHVIDGLESLTGGDTEFDHDRFLRAASAFTEAQRRHLAWENGIVLPLARKRLTTADMVELGRSMAERRSVGYPGGAPDTADRS